MDRNQPPAFGTLLRDARVAGGLTQEALAERAGLSARGIQDLERGVVRPLRDTVERLARALDLAAEERTAFLAAGARRPRQRAPASTPPSPSVEAATPLPLPLTSFIGREEALAALQGRLAGARLVTLTGPGGVGKTRLALEAATALSAEYAAPPTLVALAGLADPALVPHALAAALGVPEPPGQPLLPALATALRGGRRLLLIDNCEHLVDACAALAVALVQACPELTILATGRQPLGVGGEVVVLVPPLAMPPEEPGGEGAAAPGDPVAVLGAAGPAERGEGPAAAEAAGSEAAAVAAGSEAAAVRLFVARAAAARSGFALTAANAPTIRAICRQLDGLPLALELAAARLRALGLAELAERLDDRFRLLAGGDRLAPVRQQTLRATLDWSYDLLTEAERAVLRRLCACAGNFPLEAAEAIASGPDIAPSAVFAHVARLVEQSLVSAEEREGRAGYRLLETVRQYGRDRLAEAGEEDVAQARLRDWALGLAATFEAGLYSPEQVAWLDRLERAHDTMRGALGWCAAHDPEAGVLLAWRLRLFWTLRGHQQQARHWWERLLTALPARSSRRAAALVALAEANVHLNLSGRNEPSRAAERQRLEEGLAAAEAAGDALVAAYARHYLAHVLHPQGGGEDARALLAASLAEFERLGDIPGAFLTRHCLARWHRYFGDRAEARRLVDANLALARGRGAAVSVAIGLADLAELARGEGEGAAAVAGWEETLALARAVGQPVLAAGIAHTLALFAKRDGDYARAAALGAEGLALARRVGHPFLLCGFLHHMGTMALLGGNAAGADACYRESLSVAQELEDPFLVADNRNRLAYLALERGDLAAAREQLGEALRLLRPWPEVDSLIWTLDGCAGLAAAEGRAAEAVRLRAAAVALRGATVDPAQSDEDATFARWLEPARRALGEAAFAAAWAEGQALTREQAASAAQAILVPARAPPLAGSCEGAS